MPLIDMSETYQMTNVGAHIDGTDVYQSNRNLLDNWYFVGGGSQLGDGVFPINQRGQASYSGTGNTIDRWKCNDPAGVLSLSASGMSITVGTQFCGYQQYLPMGALVEGETYTLSIKINGTVYSWIIPSLSTSGQSQTAGWFGNNNIYSYVGVLNGNWRIMPFDSANGTTATVSGIQAIKLEAGTVSTLDNDPPPDFGEELRKCQRRLFIHDFASGDIIADGFAVSASYSICSLVLPVSMASDGTLTGTVTANPLIYGGGTGEQVSSFSVSAVKGNYAKIGVATTVMLPNYSVTLYANTNIRLTISKEL